MTSAHSRLDLPIAVVGGFFASFLAVVLSIIESSSDLRGQLLAGDPAANRAFPTTLNSMQAAIDGNDPILSAMGSYGFWTLVVIGGFFATFVILKLMRRYV